jgi:hypothetical protein
VYWTGDLDSQATLAAAGIKRICVAAEAVDRWQAAGFSATAVSPEEFAGREALADPGVAPRAGVASPTRSPWVVANGWRIARDSQRKYSYSPPPGKTALAYAEAFVYGADAAIKVDAADLKMVGALQAFLEALPAADVPALADFALVDDGSAITGEVMNLLTRRNLLYRIVKAPSGEFPMTVVIGSAEYPTAEAADPSAFALKVRRQLTDERRSLRLYGTEVVICRLMVGKDRARLHLLNYGGRDLEGLRIRVRGNYAKAEARVFGAEAAPLQDFAVVDGATEFSLPRLTTYAVIDLAR